MPLRERMTQLRLVVDELAPLHSAELGIVLRMTGADIWIPEDFDTRSESDRRAWLTSRLAKLDDKNFNQVPDVVFGDKLKRLRAISEYLAPLSKHEADAILAQAGAANSALPDDWDQLPDDARAVAMLAVINEIALFTRRGGAPVIDRLAELLEPDTSDARREAPRSSPDRMAANCAPSSAASLSGSAPVDRSGPIFVVHGHARAALHEAVRVLERATRREVIVLHEQPNAGRTILEKFEHHAAGAAYAVVLLTGDDEGAARSAPVRRARGRQNVIFELGFFFGKLGRNRVAVLLESDVERPSDIDGLVYISLDPVGAWKHALARELASVDIAVDYSRIP